MAIIFDEKNKVFHLQTKNSSYVFELCGDYIITHLHYGKKLNTIKGIEYNNEGKVPALYNVDFGYEKEDISSEVLPQEYPVYGSPDLRKPAFHATYTDGSRITKMKYVTHKIYAGKPKLNGLPSVYTESDSEAETLELWLKDDKTGLKFILKYTTIDEFDAITRSVELVNEGKENININSVMSMNIDFSDDDFDFIHLHGAWARERHIERVPLVHGTVKTESRRGASSHHHSPFFALAKKDTTEKFGEIYGFSLVYSGNFEAGVEVDSYKTARAFMGINSFDFNWLLKPGESFTAPEVVMVYSDCGMGEMSRKFHKLYRTRLARGYWRDKVRPILINNWEATYFDFNEEKLLELAKAAKKAGVELLVLDDGWFGKRDIDNCSLGDWYVDKKKLPNGLDGLANKLNEIGMKFGLWFEPEMVSPDSDLFRSHPDWCLHVNGRGKSLGRNQLILDLSREDVCDYILETLTKVLSEANIEYIKWDMNRNMSEIGSELLPPEKQAETAHRYMLGLYGILEKLKERFPKLLMEGCAGGGGRFDAGMLHYFNQYWTSDDTDPVERFYVQHGTSLVMPSAFMGAHVSAVPNHQTGRTTPFKTRGITAMCGQFGYELDVTKLSEEEISAMHDQVEIYKEVRQTILFGEMYRLLSPFEGDKIAWEYISEDKNNVVFCYFVKSTMPAMPAKYVRLEGLDENADYVLRGTDKVFNGSVLMNRGFQVERVGEYGSEMYIFDKI